MNAYELADALLKNLTMEYDCDDYMEQAANMLRQQADRIAELSKNVDELEEELLKTPQIKELNDEEILQFQDKVPYTLGSDLIDFARAILKKAQEK
jgi:archaellum component FlaC